MDQYEEKSRVYESELRTANEKNDKLLKQARLYILISSYCLLQRFLFYCFIIT